MRTVSWTLISVLLLVFFLAGCGNSKIDNEAKPLSEQERKKIDEEMRKMTSDKSKQR